MITMVYNKTKQIVAKQQALKDKILKAAREVLAERETADTSIKTIAKKAGIATGTFYLYFRNKELLIDTVVEELYTELLALIKEERAKHTDIFDKLQASMGVCVSKFMQEKHLAKILLEHFPAAQAVFNTKLTHIERELIRFVKEDLDELLARGLIPEQDTQVSAVAFVGTFRQVIFAWLSEGEPDDFSKAYQTLMDYNMRALGKWAAPK